MKTNNESKLGLLGALLCIAIIGLCLLPPAALADAQPQSFNGTNVIATGVSQTAVATNAAGGGNGGPIDVKNYRTTGFYFTGNIYNTTNGIAAFALHRLPKPATGVTNWETTPLYWINVPIPVGTNTPYSWCTNLPEGLVGPALSLAIGTQTNSLAAAGAVSNADYGLVKKAIPLTYP